jgi:hypothetical protein
MIHLQWETTASQERDTASLTGDAVYSEGDLLASPNFGICDTTHKTKVFILIDAQLGMNKIEPVTV